MKLDLTKKGKILSKDFVASDHARQKTIGFEA